MNADCLLKSCMDGRIGQREANWDVLTLPLSPDVSLSYYWLGIFFSKGYLVTKIKKIRPLIAVFNMKDFYQFKKTFKKVKHIYENLI